LRDRLKNNTEATADVQQILETVERAFAVTRQLLAFGRQQAVYPQVLNIKEAVHGFMGLLGRFVGEDVELRLDLQSTTWILADPIQVEQILLNLVLNARDAMPHGGTIDVSTRDESRHDRMMALLEVRDTGVGMDRNTREHIFEPYFTTKK